METRVHSLLLLLAVACIGIGSAELQINMITEYVNRAGETLYTPEDHITFRAATCSRYDQGYNVTVKIDMPGNPNFDRNQGLVLFALSHTNSSTNGVIKGDDIICKIDDPFNYNNTCTGKAGPGDIYIHTHSNERPDVAFSITVTFTPVDDTDDVRQAVGDFAMPETDTFTDLEQVFNHRELIQLPYRGDTLIKVTICPNQYIKTGYRFNSVFQAADGESKSLIAQAICTGGTCNFDDSTRIADNIYNLPVNVVQTGDIRAHDLWIYAVCFGGKVENGFPMGYFKFGGTLTFK